MELELTPAAQELKNYIDENPDYEDIDETDLSNEAKCLNVCMGSENFGYALYEGGYLIPSEWLQGESLKKVEEAVEIVEKFKNLVEKYHAEF